MVFKVSKTQVNQDLAASKADGFLEMIGDKVSSAELTALEKTLFQLFFNSADTVSTVGEAGDYLKAFKLGFGNKDTFKSRAAKEGVNPNSDISKRALGTAQGLKFGAEFGAGFLFPEIKGAGFVINVAKGMLQGGGSSLIADVGGDLISGSDLGETFDQNITKAGVSGALGAVAGGAANAFLPAQSRQLANKMIQDSAKAGVSGVQSSIKQSADKASNVAHKIFKKIADTRETLLTRLNTNRAKISKLYAGVQVPEKIAADIEAVIMPVYKEYQAFARGNPNIQFAVDKFDDFAKTGKLSVQDFYTSIKGLQEGFESLGQTGREAFERYIDPKSLKQTLKKVAPEFSEIEGEYQKIFEAFGDTFDKNMRPFISEISNYKATGKVDPDAIQDFMYSQLKSNPTFSKFLGKFSQSGKGKLPTDIGGAVQKFITDDDIVSIVNKGVVDNSSTVAKSVSSADPSLAGSLLDNPTSDVTGLASEIVDSGKFSGTPRTTLDTTAAGEVPKATNIVSELDSLGSNLKSFGDKVATQFKTSARTLRSLAVGEKASKSAGAEVAVDLSRQADLPIIEQVKRGLSAEGSAQSSQTMLEGLRRNQALVNLFAPTVSNIPGANIPIGMLKDALFSQ